MPQKPLSAVIFTALAVEYKAVSEFLTARQEVFHTDGAIYEIGQFTANNSTWDVGIVEISANNLGAAFEAERAIAYFRPDVILFVGVAGGIRNVVPGDVVACSKVYGYEPSGDADETFSPRSEPWVGSYKLEQRARAEARKLDWLERLPSIPSPAPKVFVAPIVAGEKLIASSKSDTSQFLQSHYEDALAVEMEGYGFFQIVQKCQESGSAMVIRGISDLIDQKSNSQRLGSELNRQKTAAQNASTFAFQLLAKFVPDRSLAVSQPDLEKSQGTHETLGILRKPHRAQCFTEPAIQLDLMLIPGGTFTMGSPADELGRYDDEGPQHEVTVPTFLMGRYPVTQAQWRAVATRTDLKVNIDLDPDPAKFKGDNRPVEQVSWHDAVEFCDRLSRLTGHTYRLPTEAEWEYACRAGTETPFHFGETITTDLANYCGEDDESQPEEYPGHYGQGPKGIYRKETTSVNHFHPLANAFGLCDLHGNVWEWCSDHWHDNYDRAPTDGSAWLTEDKEARRLLRGGSWYNDPRNCRSACRYYSNPGSRYDNDGFRLVCEAREL